MIKKWFIILLLFSAFIFVPASVHVYEIDLPEPELIQQNGHLLVEVPGCMQVGAEGEPLRPHYPLNYVLPPGETLQSVEMLVNKSKNIPLMLPLLPKQADRPLSWGMLNKGFLKKESVYAQDIYSSKQLKVDVQSFRGVNILMGTIDPLTYFPNTGNADFAESVTIKITTENTEEQARISATQYEFLHNIVQNTEILSQYILSEDEPEELLIITSQEFYTAFDILVDHYKKYGINSQIVTVSDIQLGDYAGRDIQEQIRNKIRESYLQNGLDYVLLGGGDQVIPHRGMNCEVLSGNSWVISNDIPADLYYAALDGDWDLNGNNIFGEYMPDSIPDEADLLPEIAIGRMPATTLGELLNMISKSIRYQIDPVIDDLNKHTFFGEFLYADPESWGADYLELLIGRRKDNGYPTQGLPPVLEIVKWYDQDSTDQWDKATVNNELANGTSFVHHDGHCNYTYMMKFYTSDINDSDFTTVNGIDHTTPIFYSHGCNCGGFDRSNSIASKIVTSPYISVGGVFNSRYGWFNEGQTEGPNIHLHREFENAIYGMGFDEFGWALSVSKIRTAPWLTAPNQHEQNAIRWNYYAQNILGDPAMRIFTDTPVIPDVSYDISALETGVLKASVAYDSDPIENAGLAVIDSNGVLVGFGKTNTSGYVEIDLSTQFETGDSIHCYVSGYDLILSDTVLTVTESSVEQPENFAVLNSYPNPFNPITTISYNVYESNDVKMSIYDIQGKLVEILVDAWREAGHHELKLNGSNLSSGEYICNFQIGDRHYNIKLLLLK